MTASLRLADGGLARACVVVVDETHANFVLIGQTERPTHARPQRQPID
jgi:hypothetical protein